MQGFRIPPIISNHVAQDQMPNKLMQFFEEK